MSSKRTTSYFTSGCCPFAGPGVCAAGKRAGGHQTGHFQQTKRGNHPRPRGQPVPRGAGQQGNSSKCKLKYDAWISIEDRSGRIARLRFLCNRAAAQQQFTADKVIAVVGN